MLLSKGNMKKLISKIRKEKAEDPAGRITNDTLAQHRERVLAGGRKFKYPVQYQRHKLVVNTIIIAVVALVVLVATGWYMLYKGQNTSEFMYRVTRVVPVPVAVVDGQQVKYSEYLKKYRSEQHYLVEKEQIDTKSEGGKSQLAYVKGRAMADAIADAYAAKLAKSLDVQVSDADLEVFLKQQRLSSDGEEVSDATISTVINEYYGWSPGEYREAMRSKLLRQRVAYAVDTLAEKSVESVTASVKSGEEDLKKITDEVNNSNKKAGLIYMAPAWVPRNNQDGGLAATAAKLSKGQISEAIKASSGDGYFFIKLVDSNDSQLQYEYIRIPLSEFDKKLEQVKKDGKIKEFIKIEEILPPKSE